MVDMEWVNEHFEARSEPEPAMHCRRCGMAVEYLSKHAVLRHNDKIRILPVTPSKIGRISTANAW